MSQKKKAIVVGASSDIGAALCLDWAAKGWSVTGTYRTPGTHTEAMKKAGIRLAPCDVNSPASIKEACGSISQPDWDVLVLGPAIQDPIGLFEEVDFDEWERSIITNFTSQLRFVHLLLKTRSKKEPATVLFFAGGGSNNAPHFYSAYISAKIALTKMTELLDSEIPDVKFTILGPGWVKTKIHDSTLKAGPGRARQNYQKTIEKLASGECTPMENVVGCCNWLVDSPKSVMGGRNFSVVFDKWGSSDLDAILKRDADMYKLRRQGNSNLVK